MSIKLENPISYKLDTWYMVLGHTWVNLLI